MGSLVQWMDQSWYPGHERNWDDLILRTRVLAALKSESVVLDLGAGAGLVKQMNFRGLAHQVYGIDIDPRVSSNPFLDEGQVSDINAIPYEDCRFDVVFSDNVLEHLETPHRVFREVARVLKPGGVFLFKTPNKWHYMATIARFTPHWFHRRFNRMRGRADEDTFPTRYRANSKGMLASLAKEAGLLVESLELLEGRPEYLRFSTITYLFGLAYERLVNCTDFLAPLRIVVVGTLRKPKHQ